MNNYNTIWYDMAVPQGKYRSKSRSNYCWALAHYTYIIVKLCKQNNRINIRTRGWWRCGNEIFDRESKGTSTDEDLKPDSDRDGFPQILTLSRFYGSTCRYRRSEVSTSSKMCSIINYVWENNCVECFYIL